MSVASARKRKKLRNEIMAIAGTPKREKSGRKQRASTRAEREPDGQALISRARRMGKSPKEARNMRDQMLGEDAGMAISALCRSADKAKRLWQHYVGITSAEARYHRSIGKSIHPKCAKIEMMQEAFSLDAADSIDLRTEDERDRAAQQAWMQWQGYIGHLSASEQTSIQRAVRSSSEMMSDGEPTPSAKRFVAAMIALDAVVG